MNRDIDIINPYLRSAAYFSWDLNNIYRSVAYHMRFFAFRKNAAIIRVCDQEIRIAPDTLLILKPGIPYIFRNSSPTKQFDLYCCNFDLTQEFRETKPYMPPVNEPDYVSEHVINTAKDLPELEDMVVVQGCAQLCQQVQNICDLSLSNKPYTEEIASGIIKSVLFEALQFQLNQSSSSQKTQHGAEIARAVLQYIREHCTEHINDKSVAAFMGYHPYYLTRLTQQYYNITPYRYLMQCRLNYAVHLLCNTDLSISAAADACGFSTQAHFSTFIRRETGMSPNDLRKNGWHSGNGAI